MKHYLFLTIVLLEILAAGTGSAAAASLIIDQSQPMTLDFGLGVQFFTPIGQSFTPTLNGIDFAIFGLEFFPADGPNVLRVEVRTGVNGTLLGISNPVSPLSSSFTEVQFDFPSTVPLTANQKYSLILAVQNPGLNSYGLQVGPDNSYQGGRLIEFGAEQTLPQQSFFKEGVFSQAVPEPSSLVLSNMGLLCIIYLRYRLRRIGP
jgi:hypothetical protein